MPVNEQGNLVPTNTGAAAEVVTTTRPAPTVPSADAKLAEIKARVAAANPHLTTPTTTKPAQPVTGPAGPDAKPVEPSKPPEIKPDDKALLSELGKAQANLREAQAKLKELEAKSGDSEYGSKVKKLWGGTDADKLQVLAELSGKDATEALADLVEIFYNSDGANPTATPADGKTVAPETKQLLDRIEAMSKQLEDLKQAPSKASAEQARKGTEAFLDAQFTKLGLEISSRAENRAEAIQKAISYAATVVQELGLDPANLTAEQAETVAAKALERAEAEFAQLGQRFSTTKNAKEANPSIYDRPISRSAPGLKVQPGPGPAPAPTGRGWEEYKERVRSAWEASKN